MPTILGWVIALAVYSALILFIARLMGANRLDEGDDQ